MLTIKHEDMNLFLVGYSHSDFKVITKVFDVEGSLEKFLVHRLPTTHQVKDKLSHPAGD